MLFEAGLLQRAGQRAQIFDAKFDFDFLDADRRNRITVEMDSSFARRQPACLRYVRS